MRLRHPKTSRRLCSPMRTHAYKVITHGTQCMHACTHARMRALVYKSTHVCVCLCMRLEHTVQSHRHPAPRLPPHSRPLTSARMHQWFSQCGDADNPGGSGLCSSASRSASPHTGSATGGPPCSDRRSIRFSTGKALVVDEHAWHMDSNETSHRPHAHLRDIPRPKGLWLISSPGILSAVDWTRFPLREQYWGMARGKRAVLEYGVDLLGLVRTLANPLSTTRIVDRSDFRVGQGS